MAKYFPEFGWIGCKNRDRNYKPTIEIRESTYDDTKTLCIWDEKTHYTEGLNSHGIAIISAALQTKDDEKEGKDGKSVGTPKKSKYSHHGKAIRASLRGKTLEEVIHLAIEDHLDGNTLFFTKDDCYVMEATQEDGEFVYKIKKIEKDQVVVRTNHGILLKNAGYRWDINDKKQSLSRYSSETRYVVALMQAQKAETKDDFFKASLWHEFKIQQLNPCRLDEEKDAMRTTGQIIVCPKEMTLWYRPIFCGIEFDYNFLNKYDSKMFFELLSLSPLNLSLYNEKEDKKELDESNRIFSGVRLDEIPQKYKHLKVLGRGATSVVLEKDNDTVLIFTRDAVKTDWLTQSWGLALAKWVDSYDSHKHHIRAFNEKPINILEMPKLYPLDLKNKRIVRDILKDFEKIKSSAYSKSYGRGNYSDREFKIGIINQYQEFYNDHDDEFEDDRQLRNLIDFLSNYDEKQYDWDLGPRNFKQTQDGKLIVLDPVVDRELIELYRSSKFKGY